MSILTILLFIILGMSIFYLVIILRKDYKDIAETRNRLKYIKSLGLFTFVAGILGQLVGLFSAFSAIERAMEISPPIMAGGLKVSMITTIYGALIFLVSYLCWIIIDYIASRMKLEE